ncbi:MAG: hypothetical protein GY774_09560 [Planctomycetes bacterium]|nr:hypothetical protein [Planctomycetota bacterium]
MKTKPIQTQFKPNQSQSKPILGQYQGWQSQTNPIQSQLKPKQTQFFGFYTVNYSKMGNLGKLNLYSVFPLLASAKRKK